MTSSLSTDFCCCDCDESFKSASQLLTHFALHASQKQFSDINSFLDHDRSDSRSFNLETPDKNCQKIDKKPKVPDLYPISINKKCINKVKNERDKVEWELPNKKPQMLDLLCQIKDTSKNNEESNKCLASHSLNIQNGNDLEDFCPLKYCSVTMEENKQSIMSYLADMKSNKQFVSKKSDVLIKSSKCNSVLKKKYQCSVCLKMFGWSTDLKRHLLIHTGEKPFKCDQCDACFTRNFLLQKHVSKVHLDDDLKVKIKSNIPRLNPIVTKTDFKILNSSKKTKRNNGKKTFSNESSTLQSNFNKIHVINLVKSETLVQ